MNTSIAFALKEWDLVCSALLNGSQTILLRKGGILESANEFELEHKRFLLFPTFIHQDPRMLKEAHRANVISVRNEPDHVTLRGYGEAVRIFEVPCTNGRAAVDRLSDLHMWDSPLIDMRFAYRPEKPLYVVVVRAWNLPQTLTIPNTLEYAGCKSWVPLDHEINIEGATPALPDDRIHQVIQQIETAFRPVA
jgi:hypothetical protein